MNGHTIGFRPQTQKLEVHGMNDFGGEKINSSEIPPMVQSNKCSDFYRVYRANKLNIHWSISFVENSSRLTISMKTTEQYFPVVLFITLYNVVLTFESVDEILKCDHSNESY